MRIASLAVALAVAAFPTVSSAQEVQGVKADEQIIIKQLQTDRRGVIADNLKLSDSESRAFWPIYDKYEADMKKVTDRRMAMLDKYATEYDTLTDAQADELLKARYGIDKDALAIKQKYAKQIQKALPSVKALRYVQLQDRIDVLLASNMFAIIPLAR
jgi:hypothetical protein